MSAAGMVRLSAELVTAGQRVCAHVDGRELATATPEEQERYARYVHALAGVFGAAGPYDKAAWRERVELALTYLFIGRDVQRIRSSPAFPLLAWNLAKHLAVGGREPLEVLGVMAPETLIDVARDHDPAAQLVRRMPPPPMTVDR